MLVLLLIPTLFVSCSSSSEEIKEEVEMVKLYLDVNFEENIIFSRYDVDVKVNGDNVGTIKHGDYFTSLQEVPKGDCKIVFQKVDEASVDVTKKLSLEGDTTYKCIIASHSDEIEIKEEEVIEGIEGMSIAVPDVVGINLEEARQQLENAGFVNITAKGSDGDTIWYEPDWFVKDQSVKPGSEIDKNQEIILTCVEGKPEEEKEEPVKTDEDKKKEEPAKEESKVSAADKEKLESFVGEKCFDVTNSIKNTGYTPIYEAARTFQDMTSQIEAEMEEGYTENEWIIVNMTDIDADNKTVTYVVTSAWQRENLF